MRERFADYHHTSETPEYKWNSPKLWKAIGVAAILITINVGMMPLLADTVLATIVLAIFGFSQLIGAIAIGIPISIGRYFGSVGLQKNNTGMAIVGVIFSMFGFGAFGGAVISLYPDTNVTLALVITAIIVTLLTLAFGIYIFTRKPNFQKYLKYSLYCFISGSIILLIVDLGFSTIHMLGYLLFLLGWTFELGYEIGMSSSEKRNALANGFSLYVAFTGVFVHIMQLVLEALASD